MGGDSGGRCGLSVKGLSSAITGSVVPGGKRKSPRPRNDPICGPAAEHRPGGWTGGVDGRPRGCPRPSPGRWVPGREAQISETAQRPYMRFCRRAPTQGAYGRGGCPVKGLPSTFTGSVAPGEKCKSANRATTLYAVLPPSADPRGGRTVGMSGQGAALGHHRVGGAGGQRKSAKSRNDPTCGPAAERRPEGRMVRTDGADCRSRGCPRPSPSRRCRAGSANRRERATTLYAVLPPSADPRDGRAAWTVGQGAALDLHRAGGAGRQAQIGQTSQRPYMRSCRRAPTRWWAARAGRVDARATGVDGRLEGRP